MGYKLILMLDSLFYVLNILIFIRVITTWIPINRYSKWAQLLYGITDPFLLPFENLVRKNNWYIGNMDISPILALLFVQWILQPAVNFLIRLLF